MKKFFIFLLFIPLLSPGQNSLNPVGKYKYKITPPMTSYYVNIKKNGKAILRTYGIETGSKSKTTGIWTMNKGLIKIKWNDEKEKRIEDYLVLKNCLAEIGNKECLYIKEK